MNILKFDKINKIVLELTVVWYYGYYVMIFMHYFISMSFIRLLGYEL